MTLIIAAACTAIPDEAPESTAQVNTAKSAECAITPSDQPVACTMQYDPVCGCDGKTYGNACMARGAGVPRSEPGACDKNLNQ